ncbi:MULTISPECIES: hypothetical protein [unclassified Mycolicibacterium]
MTALPERLTAAQPGQILLKDLVLIGVALWTLGEAWGAARKTSGELRSTM